MNKKLLLILLVCFGLFLSSCSKTRNKAPAGKPSPSVQVTAPENADKKTAEAVTRAPTVKPSPTIQATAPEKVVQNTPTPAADSGLTLEGLKAEAIRLGYEVTPIEGYQLMDEPKPSDGFNIHYKDENSDSYIPVFEFGSPAQALEYARNVNESGYDLCIVNGPFVTMTKAQYGVVMIDAEAAFLAGLLKSEVMAPPPVSGEPIIVPASDYPGAVKQVGILTNILNTLVNRTVLTHDKSAPPDRNFSAAYIDFRMLTSGNLGFTSYLSENEDDRNMMHQIWTGLGVKDMEITRTAAHTYEVTGIRAGMPDPFLISCAFDPQSGSLRLVETNGEFVSELIEFVPLGEDRYAFQTLSERAVITYKDSEITAFAYSLLKSEMAGYDPESDGIFKKTGLNEEWVMAAGENSYSQRVTYDGTVLKIHAESFFTGSIVSADISVP